MRWKINFAACTIAFCVCALKAKPDTIFAATLNGAADGVTTPASGYATVDFNPSLTQISFFLTFQGLTTPATMGHIHAGAPGVSGPILLWFFPADLIPTPTATSGSYSGVWTQSDLATQSTDPAITTFAELFSNMEADLTYVNVHTTAYPGGEIRGQLLLTPEPATLLPCGLALALISIIALLRMKKVQA